MFGLHLVSIAVGVALAQVLPVTVTSWIKGKMAAAAASAVVAKVEAEVKKVL
jgi:hypothetical protein